MHQLKNWHFSGRSSNFFSHCAAGTTNRGLLDVVVPPLVSGVSHCQYRIRRVKWSYSFLSLRFTVLEWAKYGTVAITLIPTKSHTHALIDCIYSSKTIFRSLSRGKGCKSPLGRLLNRILPYSGIWSTLLRCSSSTKTIVLMQLTTSESDCIFTPTNSVVITRSLSIMS